LRRLRSQEAEAGRRTDGSEQPAFKKGKKTATENDDEVIQRQEERLPGEGLDWWYTWEEYFDDEVADTPSKKAHPSKSNVVNGNAQTPTRKATKLVMHFAGLRRRSFNPELQCWPEFNVYMWRGIPATRNQKTSMTITMSLLTRKPITRCFADLSRSPVCNHKHRARISHLLPFFQGLTKQTYSLEISIWCGGLKTIWGRKEARMVLLRLSRLGQIWSSPSRPALSRRRPSRSSLRVSRQCLPDPRLAKTVLIAPMELSMV
jgi:hypothetical protein